ncbi:peptidoglycan editing factor PgeF [Alphaproteobacteria bacterium]|nr:peptidoglycan editing factor PgeF [Alphaproteobacteria bacterium]
MTPRRTQRLPAIEAPALRAVPGIRHGFFTREGGVSTGLYHSLNCGFGSDDDPINVTENRRRVCDAFDVPGEALITSYQVHGAKVFIVKQAGSCDFPPKADGLATSVPGIALGILSADCAPVLFADSEAGVIGACHAGWRGALDGIIDATLVSMERLGAQRSQICAAIGPCIAQMSYQVGPEFRKQFIAADDSNERLFDDDDEGRYLFDLPGFVINCLAHAGIADGSWVGLDNFTEDQQLFSYRRSTHRGEADFGRGLSAIMLAEQ